MNAWLTWVLTGLSFLLVVVAVGYVVADRATDRWLLALLGLLGAGTVVQLFVGAVALVRTDHDVSAVVFVAYLAGLVLVAPLSAVWALGEQSRSGTAVLIVAGLTVPALLLRLDSIWTAAGG